MRILKVLPKEVYITTEFSYQELLLLKEGLDATELNLDVTTERGSQIDSYMKNILYPTIANLITELDGE